ncbi:hypothetical protein BDZ90DRAFT_249657 [Jaminaea rosea]|uniref:RING-type E3 ubiquitin transferase (cysteine targeting) n=1 Tax=Jaminaea rosea TaxID=1569628 RepID=A0A316UX05_9BASI|nr:hypothetical protein BDZ90DRAFT_249657 [Jaminaea rosea]PWN29762.1 hypothetical protein BDZ90DRAFT_249657 [Jaminaea rosea]
MADDGGPSNAIASSSRNSLDHFWSQAASDAHPRISQIRRRLPHFPSAPLRIQRVSQLDAELLDEELLTLLFEPVKTSLAQIKNTLPDRIEPELLALLKLVLFKYSVWDNGASYGAMLQNLRYRNEWAHRGGLQSTFLSAPLSKVQLALYPLLTIGVPYAYARLSRHMTSLSFSSMPANDPRRLLWSMVDKLQRLHEGLALVNFAAFLSDGKYRTITDRMLGMRLTYAERTLNRNVSFEFLNRQLVWHAFTEFLLFLLPIIRPKRLLRRLLRLPTHPRILAFWLAVLPRWFAARVGLYRDAISGRPRYRLPFRLPTSASKGDASSKGAGKYSHLPEGICPICWQRVESETSSTSPVGSSLGNVGIPSSDPLDPSSSALAPSTSQQNTLASSNASATRREYHNASRSFGVSNDGVPYANALLHNAYRAKPCGCEYCYVCLAEKLLSEEAGEELEDSMAAADRGIGAWDCLRCGAKVRGMERVVAIDDNDDEEKAPERPTARRRRSSSSSSSSSSRSSSSSSSTTPSSTASREAMREKAAAAASARRAPPEPVDDDGDDDDAELDIGELTR